MKHMNEMAVLSRRSLLVAGAAWSLAGLPRFARAQGAAWPESAELSYDMTGFWLVPLTGTGNIHWAHDSESYALDLTINAAILSFLYSSHGRIGPDGLEPTAYREKRIGRDRTVSIDHDAHSISFSWKDGRLDMPEGVQDSVSAMLQISHLLMQKTQVVPGERFSFPMARMGSLTEWSFQVVDTPVVEAPFGQYQTWHVERLPTGNASDNDLRVQFWLAPALGGLPLQIAFDIAQDSYLLVTLSNLQRKGEVPNTPSAPPEATPTTANPGSAPT